MKRVCVIGKARRLPPQLPLEDLGGNRFGDRMLTCSLVFISMNQIFGSQRPASHEFDGFPRRRSSPRGRLHASNTRIHVLASMRGRFSMTFWWRRAASSRARKRCTIAVMSRTLHFDVPRRTDVFFDQHRSSPKPPRSAR